MELIRKLAGKDLLTISAAGIAGAATDIFCIDGNCAGTAGIAEMLLQSHERTEDGGFILDLLPRCRRLGRRAKSAACEPAAGSSSDLAWKDGRLNRATVRRVGGSGKNMLRYGSRTLAVNLMPRPDN